MRRACTSFFFGLSMLYGLTAASAQRLSQEAGLRNQLVIESHEYAPRSWHIYAQLESGHDSIQGTDRALFGGLQLGGEVTFDSRYCQLLSIGGHGRAGLQLNGGILAAEQWASACLAVEGLMAFSFGHHLEWQVTPSLASPLVAPAGRYSRETLILDVTVLDYPIDLPQSRERLSLAHSIWRASFDPTTVGDPIVAPMPGQPLESVGRDFQFSIDVDLVRYTRDNWAEGANPDDAWSIGGLGPMLQFGNLTIGGGILRDAAVFNLRVVDIDNLPLFDSGVRLSSGFNWGSTSVYAWDDGREPFTRIRAMTGHLQLFGDVEHMFGRGAGWRAQLGYERRTWPTFDYNAVLEDRVSMSTSRRRNGQSFSASGFLAYSSLIDADTLTLDGAERFVTGGGRIDIVQPIFGQFAITTGVEVARSFYSQLSGQTAPLPGWGMRAFVALTRTWSGASNAQL